MDNAINESDAFSFTEEDIAEEANIDFVQENIKHMLANCYFDVQTAIELLYNVPDGTYKVERDGSNLITKVFSNSPDWCLFRTTCPKLWKKFTDVFYKKFKKD